jgi:hypothetical protein
MAISTYAGLKTALASLINRRDFADAIPTFIALLETDFDADPRTALHRRRICRSQSTIDSEYKTLPANYLSLQSVDLDTSPTRRLKYVEPDNLVRMKEDNTQWQAISAGNFGSEPGPPEFYSIVGTEIRFLPAPQTSYTCDLTVYERLDALAEDADTNWLLTYFPHIYLYGSALHSAPHLGADDRLDMWRSLYSDAVVKLMDSDPVKTDSSPLRMDHSGLVRPGRAF